MGEGWVKDGWKMSGERVDEYWRNHALEASHFFNDDHISNHFLITAHKMNEMNEGFQSF